MLRDIAERDWKLFRQLQTLALDRFCERVLSEVTTLASDTGKSQHERYLAIYRLMQRRDRELADAFNDPRRSRALHQLALIRSRHLLTDEEFARFTDETRAAVEILAGG